MIKVLLFDVDGVLTVGTRFSEKFAKEQGLAEDAMETFFKGPFIGCLTDKADLKEVIAPHLEDWGWTKGADSFIDYWFAFDNEYDQELIAYIQESRKKGIKCYLATNQEKYRAEYMLEKLGFKDTFDKLYASAHLGYKKPDIEFFSKLVADLGDVQKEEILFWDDREENITAAKEFGINAEIYTTFEDFKNKMKKYSFEN